ncbi:hypothetical protein [Proteus terrae]|uniref:hypothetical protein n=1 Tax=Proteus terrae TaxID=1574161 RepID=UPI0034D46580
MNDELHKKFLDFLYKNINSILFWVIMFFILPIIFFIITYGFFSNNIDKLGAFGSYIGGVSTFFISVLTLFTLIMLYITYIKTINFNKNQLKIAQNELEINNFNYIINIINNNIKNEENLTKLYAETRINSFYEKTKTNYLSEKFINILNSPKAYIEEKKLTPELIDLLKKKLIDKSIKIDIRSYAKEYAKYIDYKELNSIFPLIKSLCVKINNNTDKEQKELLSNILIASIDSQILFWSLALINDSCFDKFMVIPSYIIERVNFDV